MLLGNDDRMQEAKLVMPHNRFANRDDWLDKLAIDSAKPGGDINLLALIKGNERYVFLYSDDRRTDTLRTFGRFACNDDLSFTWHDAAVLSQKIREGAK